MRKDLWIGGIAATVAHSAVVWFSLFPARPAAKPPGDLAEPPMVMIAPPPVPEEVDMMDLPEDRPPASPLAPSLPDISMAGPEAPFTQPIQPAPPGVVTGDIHVIPSHAGGFGPPAIPTFDSKDLSQPPVPTSTPRPQYPFAMRSAGIEGKVVVDFIVDEHGAVQRATALEGPANDFKTAAVAGLRRWRFRPGMKEGKAVRTHMQIPLVFNLQR